MAIELVDFKPVKRHDGYLIRDLADNGTGSGQYVELIREDGWCLGAMTVEHVETAIEADNAPATGTTLAASFGDTSGTSSTDSK